MESATTADRVLAALEQDAQASVADIAAAAEVSKPTARKYIAQLEAEGVIVGYSADLDPKKLLSATIALVGVDVESDQYVAVSRQLRSIPEIRSLYSSSGDHMLMAEVRAADGDAVGDVISEAILNIDGVTAAHPTFLRERLK
jgi:transcriptional regulator, AsnC family